MQEVRFNGFVDRQDLSHGVGVSSSPSASDSNVSRSSEAAARVPVLWLLRLRESVGASSVVASQPWAVGRPVSGRVLAFVGMRCNCRRILPFSRILSASGEARRRLPKVGSPIDLGGNGDGDGSFATSTTVAFLESGTGMRDAVLMLVDLRELREALPGLGLEKLAGEGLCGRDSVDVGDVVSSRLCSIEADD